MSDERVAAASDVPPNEVRVVECGGRSLALSNIDGEVYAIDNVCTHDGGPLGEGEIDGFQIICPRHGARFDICTGAAMTMPAVRATPAHEVRVEGEDVLVKIKE